MAATSTPESRGLLSAGGYRLLRELGSRALTTYAVLHEADPKSAHLFVVERFARGGSVSDEEAADYIRDARRIAELEHPNIVRVREVAIRADEVLVGSDFIEGEPLGSMLGFGADAGAVKAPLEVVLRVMVDVLTGLGALHNLRDVKRQPLKLVHGELSPANVVVATDGSARLVQVCRVAGLATRPGRTGCGYLAPEVLLADGSADPRSDVYSVGVLLWEALCGRRMLAEAPPHAIVAHILSGRIVRATAPADAEWAGELVTLAHRALSADPNARFANAAQMAAELRRVAGSHLATTGKVSSFIKQAYGAKIAARRQALVTFEGSVVTTSPAPVPTRPTADVDDVDDATQSRMTTSPPPPVDDGFDVNLDDDPDDGERAERATAPPPDPSAPVLPVATPAPIAAAPPAPAPAPVAAPPPIAARTQVAPPKAWTAIAAPIASPPAPPVAEEAPTAKHAAIAPPHAPIVVAPATFATPLPAPSPAPSPKLVPIASQTHAPAPTPIAPPTPAPSPAAAIAPPTPPPSAPAAIAPPARAPVQLATLPIAFVPSAEAPAQSTSARVVTEVEPMPPAVPFDVAPSSHPPRPRRWVVPVAIGIPLVVLLTWGGCQLASHPEPPRAATSSTTTKPAPIVIPPPPPTETTTASATAPATAAPPDTAAASPTPPVATAPPAETAPAETSTGPHPPAFVPGYVPPKPTAKPRPTYDPQGI